MTDTLQTLKALKQNLERKLQGHPDFQALQAINIAIIQIEQATAQPKKHVLKAETGKFSTSFGSPTITHSSSSRANLVATIIEEAGAPVTTKDLLDALGKRGEEIGGKDPMINLASTLSRDKRFRSVSYRNSKAWWFTDKPYPGELFDVPPKDGVNEH